MARSGRKPRKMRSLRPEAASGTSAGSKQYGSKRPLISELELAVAYAERKRDFMAQHGPVRILMKDGKPVEPDDVAQ